MNTRKVANQIDLKLRILEEILSENPSRTWDSRNLPAKSVGLWQDTSQEDAEERYSAQRFRSLGDEVYGMIGGLLSHLYSEGVDVRDPYIEAMEREFFPSPTPQQFVRYARHALGVLRAKSTEID